MNEKELINKILSKTQYQGNTESNKKEISASSFGSDLLQIWLRYKYGVIEKKDFGQDTIGTLVHYSLQEILKDEYEVEKHLELKFDNGWKLTGSIDLINDKEIIDIKVTKQYTLEKIHTEQNHQYIQQLSVYKYLAKKILNKDLDIKLLFILKDGGYNFRKGLIEPSIVLKNINYLGDDFIESKFNDIVSKIEQYEEIGKEPEQCKDLWFRKVNGKAIPIRCEQYCSYKEVCPYYKSILSNINF